MSGKSFSRPYLGQWTITQPVPRGGWLPQRRPFSWPYGGANAPIGNLSESFSSTTINNQLWAFDSHDQTNTSFSTSGTFSQDGTKVRLGNGSVTAFDDTCHYQALGVFNLIGSSVVVNMRPAGTPTTVGGEFNCGIHMDDPANLFNSGIIFVLDRAHTGDTFFKTLMDRSTFPWADTTVAYNDTSHQWLRVRESAGSLFWDAAPSTASNPPIETDWVNVSTTTWPDKIKSFSLSAVAFYLFYQLTGTVGTTGETFVDFDSINLPPAAVVQNLTGTNATGQTGTPTIFVDAANTGVVSTTAINTTTVDVLDPLTGASGNGQLNTTTVLALAPITGNPATGQTNTTTVGLSRTLSGLAATGQVGTVTVADTVLLTGNSATGQIGTVTPVVSFTQLLTGVSATGQTSTTTIALSVNNTGVVGTGAVNTQTVVLARSLTGSQASGAVNTATVLDQRLLTGSAATGIPGSVTAAAPGSAALSGVLASGLAGTLSAPAPTVSAGRSHQDLYIRQLLEEYYTKEWNKEPPKSPEIVAPKTRKRQVRQAIEELVPQDPMLAVAVSRLATQQQALQVSLASLQHSFHVQSQQLSEARAAREEEDDDLLLLSSII